MEEPIISTENKSNGEVVQSQPQPQSQPQALIEAKPPKDKRRHFLAAFFLSFFWGAFGVDRFYLGKVFTGILKLLTFGGLGIWTAIDIALIMSGAMRDRQGTN